MGEPAEKAKDYREGFIEGAHALLEAVGDHLPENQLRVLEKWVSGPLHDWRDADARAHPPPLPMIDGA